MNDPVESVLKNLRTPSPDPQARLRAKRAALAEFARVRAAEEAPPNNVSQALFRWLRLSRDTTHGSTSMWNMNRGLWAGAAGVGVLAMGLATVLPNLKRYDAELTQPTLDPAARSIAEDAGKHEVPAPASPVVDARQDEAAQREAEAAVAVAAVETRRANPIAQLEKDLRESHELQTSEAEPMDELVVSGVRMPVPVTQDSKRSTVEFTNSAIVNDAVGYPQPGVQVTSQAARKVEGVANAAFSAPAPPPPPAPGVDEGRDQFEHFESNPLRRVAEEPVSTFSADVDTASYSFVRAQLDRGQLPQKDAVRVEELVNYFDYAWPAASSRKTPFEPTVVVSDSPWAKGRKLVHIGIKGYELDRDSAPDANLVLLLDVSGSMNAPNRLPLAVRSMELLLESLKPTDTVGIVVYAGQAGTVLEPTPVRNKERIVEALRSLTPGGSTAGAAGIERAYQLAEAHFRKGGVNRILLATDGDFNVGIAGTEALKGFVERKRDKGVYLSVLGFGQGNYRDELAQALAQNGNGVAAYIDTENEARKVLVQQASGSLFTIARDVKLQVEFNPVTVSEYRLVGYETRALRREDFNNDAVDAGDVGAGHTVTAIYEVTPVGATPSVDEPRYEGNAAVKKSSDDKSASGSRNEYGFLKIRYKLPGENESRLMSEAIPVRTRSQPAAISRDVAFSTAVAGFGQLLRGGAFTGSLTYEDVLRQAQAAKGDDVHGYRAEFVDLVRRAQRAQDE